MNNKYDVWHKDIVGRFGSLLGQNMQDFYTVIGKVRERGGREREREEGERERRGEKGEGGGGKREREEGEKGRGRRVRKGEGGG